MRGAEPRYNHLKSPAIGCHLNELGEESPCRHDAGLLEGKAVEIGVGGVKSDLEDMRRTSDLGKIVEAGGDRLRALPLDLYEHPRLSILDYHKVDLPLFQIAQIVEAVLSETVVGPEVDRLEEVGGDLAQAHPMLMRDMSKEP